MTEGSSTLGILWMTGDLLITFGGLAVIAAGVIYLAKSAFSPDDPSDER